MQRRIRAYAALLVTTCVLSGCQLFRSDPPPLDRWSGPIQDLRIQWSAADRIDLTEGAAVPIRAYMESSWLGQWQGSLDYVYPGYTEAVPPNIPDGNDIRAISRRFETGYRVRSPFYGDSQFRIMSIDESNRDVTTLICNYTYTVAKSEADGVFYSVARTESREPRGIFPMRVFLTAPQTQTETVPQVGPSPAPSTDVFGGWKVAGLLTVYSVREPGFAQVWPTFDADTAACVADAPDSPERRAFLSSGQHPRSDFPTSPPFPGWPETPKN